MTNIPMPFTPKQHRSNRALTEGVLTAAAAAAASDQKKTKEFKFPHEWPTALKTWCFRCQYPDCVTPWMYESEAQWQACMTYASAVENRKENPISAFHNHLLGHFLCSHCYLQFLNTPFVRTMIRRFTRDRDPTPADLKRLAGDQQRLKLRTFGPGPLTAVKAKKLNCLLEMVLPIKAMEMTRSKMAETAQYNVARLQKESGDALSKRTSLRFKMKNAPVPGSAATSAGSVVTMSIDTKSPVLATAMEQDKGEMTAEMVMEPLPSSSSTQQTILAYMHGLQNEPRTPPPLERQNGYYYMVPHPTPEKAAQSK
jgi:hypothetical protein